MNVIQFVNKNKIRKEASKWIIRLDGKLPSEKEVQELMVWLETSPHHQSEFIELANLWGYLDTLSALSDLIPLDTSSSSKSAMDSARPLLGWVNYSPAACASIIIISLFGLFATYNSQWFSPLLNLNSGQTYSTQIGVKETILLSDGSSITLNTNSTAKVEYNKASRSIFLQQGEAYFDVAKDAQRPFTVHVGNGSVTALGTAFNIHYSGQVVDVIVTEGVVEVESPAPQITQDSLDFVGHSEATSHFKTPLAENHSMRFDASTSKVAEIDPKQIDRELAWQRGMLIFDGHSLQEAIEEITRYTNTRIIINDPELSNMRVGGYFKTGQIEPMLAAFESSFGIRVTRLDNEQILLSKRNN